MNDEQLNTLKEAARAATPQDIDTAESVERHEGGYIECPVCSGEGRLEIEADYCNYDSVAIGVQFYGIGPEHGAAEAYFRAASPALILSLIERLERAESSLAASASAEPEFSKVVPHEPTKEMLEAGREQLDRMGFVKDVWQAMYCAAKEPK